MKFTSKLGILNLHISLFNTLRIHLFLMREWTLNFSTTLVIFLFKKWSLTFKCINALLGVIPIIPRTGYLLVFLQFCGEYQDLQLLCDNMQLHIINLEKIFFQVEVFLLEGIRKSVLSLYHRIWKSIAYTSPSCNKPFK